MAWLRAASLLLLAGSALGADLPSIQMKGSKFFFPNGTQFFFKGVAYQQDTGAAGTTSKNASIVDPLADETRCKQDVPLLAQLNTNIIRTYAIDPTADHSACMKLLNDAGIYVISDLGQPNLSINRDSPQWTVDLFTRYQQVVDALAKYPNVVGFFAGNEVSNSHNNTAASAYVKAAVRDTKQYIKNKKYRWMGVGYAANDDLAIRDDIASYFNCGPTDESIDYFGYNIYSWCGDSDFQKSGYDRLIDFFKDYSVPTFFAEYGCNLPNGGAGRVFDETTALYSANMSQVLSGGIVYEFFQDTNDYGLVKVGSDGSPSKQKDFSALQTKIRGAQPKGVSMSDYNPSNKAMSCPTVNSSWQASDTLPPTPDANVCSCMVKTCECVPADGLAATSYSDIFDFICGKDASLCSGIQGNATTGKYGVYSMCDSKDQLAYALNAYYNDQKKAKDACSFKGQAKTQTATKNSNCSALASSPGSNSTGSSGSKDNGAAGTRGGALTLGGLCSTVALVSAGMLLL
ncbi:1,3-beta-glucanosyltransferase [Purpureocillium lilacinum]|uniref:1,3-beta-glucanosyltransferase n=2 Tax=Purpureocillium lilacinum TaxID=33203 RepID=A0A179GKQ6_PURLI|nr:1,3-beta-glucanosyltransferase [Purpureocillium lilacinum]OAQ77980.1 1,3-beta-glucanosyltransferase [Purpureocillium lilacinum]